LNHELQKLNLTVCLTLYFFYFMDLKTASNGTKVSENEGDHWDRLEREWLGLGNGVLELRNGQIGRLYFVKIHIKRDFTKVNI
jgi:hypothetical protein